MKKVIKPSKQPTKKRSKQRTQSTQTAETAKLKIAIGKISTQLVKDHPKLIKGGGSLGITELLFSKILIKGGKLSQQTRGYIITFLKDIAPQVIKLKQELIIKLLENLKALSFNNDNFENIININREFVKDLYEYDINDDIQDRIGNLSEEIKEYIAILDIVKKYYILSRVKDDKEQDSIKEEINNNKFVPLPNDILQALSNDNKERNKLINDYFEKKKIDSGNGVPKVEEGNIEKALQPLKIETPPNIIDTDKKKVKTPPGSASPALMEVKDILTDGSPNRVIDVANEVGWRVSPPTSPWRGGNPAKYKSTGQVVYIMYKNKKYKRVIYVKDKRNTRYCKINKEYILLSKLKVIQ